MGENPAISFFCIGTVLKLNVLNKKEKNTYNVLTTLIRCDNIMIRKKEADNNGCYECNNAYR